MNKKINPCISLPPSGYVQLSPLFSRKSIPGDVSIILSEEILRKYIISTRFVSRFLFHLLLRNSRIINNYTHNVLNNFLILIKNYISLVRFDSVRYKNEVTRENNLISSPANIEFLSNTANNIKYNKFTNPVEATKRISVFSSDVSSNYMKESSIKNYLSFLDVIYLRTKNGVKSLNNYISQFGERKFTSISARSARVPTRSAFIFRRKTLVLKSDNFFDEYKYNLTSSRISKGRDTGEVFVSDSKATKSSTYANVQNIYNSKIEQTAPISESIFLKYLSDDDTKERFNISETMFHKTGESNVYDRYHYGRGGIEEDYSSSIVWYTKTAQPANPSRTVLSNKWFLTDSIDRLTVTSHPLTLINGLGFTSLVEKDHIETFTVPQATMVPGPDLFHSIHRTKPTNTGLTSLTKMEDGHNQVLHHPSLTTMADHSIGGSGSVTKTQVEESINESPTISGSSLGKEFPEIEINRLAFRVYDLIETRLKTERKMRGM